MSTSLPTIQLGNRRVTRLIAGGNPVHGGAHSTRRVSEHMNAYFTVEKTVEFVLHCEKEGINTWQSSYSVKERDALLKARERGSKIQWFLLSHYRPWENWTHKDALALKPIAIVHHGDYTDQLFRQGKQTLIHDAVKEFHDLGVLAGISTHSPENLARCEDAGWENDFYMTCFYNVKRDPEEIRRRLGDVPISELYFKSDPDRMAERIRQVKKPCLAFKILAAGRLCNDKASVERAFAFAFRNIKPTDGVIVGMYPVFHDEVRENAEFARQYGALS